MCTLIYHAGCRSTCINGVWNKFVDNLGTAGSPDSCTHLIWSDYIVHFDFLRLLSNSYKASSLLFNRFILVRSLVYWFSLFFSLDSNFVLCYIFFIMSKLVLLQVMDCFLNLSVQIPVEKSHWQFSWAVIWVPLTWSWVSACVVLQLWSSQLPQ